MRITEEHVEHFLRHGYAIVERFLDADEVAACRREIDELVAAKEGAGGERLSWAHWQFPFAEGGVVADAITHPEILAFVEEVVGTDQIVLDGSSLSVKHGGEGQYSELLEQDLHVDFYNNSLAYPRDDGGFRHVPMILYYTDVDEDNGPTWVVSQEHTRSRSLVPSWVSREDAPELYEHQRPALVPEGSLLLYGMRTFHRGSGFRSPTAIRYSTNSIFRAAACEWMGQASWPSAGGTPEMHAFVERATPKQRSLLGFPEPGHAYWNEDTLAGVAARYPGMDMAPYREAALSSTPGR